MIVRALIPLAAAVVTVAGQLAPPSWGMLTPSPLIKIEKSNGTRNSIHIPYDLTAAYRNMGLPDDYRLDLPDDSRAYSIKLLYDFIINVVVYNYSFEYPNNPFVPPSTGYTYIYGSKGATYEWWRPPRTEDGRPILPHARGRHQHQRPAGGSADWWGASSEPNDDRVWIPIGQDQQQTVPKPEGQTTMIHAAPLYGAAPIIYILGNSDASGDHHDKSIDGPVENRERDFPPGFFAANRDDDRSFALLRRFAADRDDEGFARFAADKDEDGFARFAADKDENGFARFAALPSRFNIDPRPLVQNRNDLLWTRR